MTTSAKPDPVAFQTQFELRQSKISKGLCFLVLLLIYSYFSRGPIKASQMPDKLFCHWAMFMTLLKSWPHSVSQAGCELVTLPPSVSSHWGYTPCTAGLASIYWVEWHFSAYKYWDCEVIGDAFWGVGLYDTQHMYSVSQTLKSENNWIINFMWLQGEEAKRLLWSIFKLNIWTGGSWGLSYFICIKAIISL